MTTYDAAIIGLGAMGSAAAWHLARRGVSVIGFDQFRPPHNLGSSHGESRVIREAYYEDPSYVPLVQRAYELWGELGAETDQTLLRETGALMVSEADGLLVAGALASARQHGIPHEALTAGEIRQRFPAMAAREPMVGLLEHRAALMPVAECDASLPLHQDIAEAGAVAAEGAAQVLSELRADREASGKAFSVRIARRELRQWLSESEEGLAVEGLVARLLG